MKWLAAASLLVLPALMLGCSAIAERCHDGTLLVVVTLDATTAPADTLAVTLSTDDGTKTTSLPHTPGHASGNIVVAFPSGYPRGKAVAIDVQALAGNVVLGAGHASQLLDASCEVTPLAVTGSAAGDLGGSDAAADLLAPAPGDMARVDQGAPPDLFAPPDMTCIPVAESGDNCFDGIDNDCDGLVDCADSDCTNAQCVPPITTPFSIGIAVDVVSFCPTLYNSRSLLYSGLSGGSCSTAGCSCTGVESCSVETESYQGSACGGESDDNSASSTCRNFDVTGATKGVSVAAIAGNGGSCSPSGSSSAPAATWTTKDTFCATAYRGGGCTGGMICVPKQQSETTCEVADGTVACDPGYTATGGPWFTGDNDGRSCACACGAASGGSCGTSVAFYAASGCSGTAALTLAASTQNCSPPGTPYESLKIVGGTAPSCGAATANVTGTLAGTGPQTYCCLP
ncbi:MAG TPA: hypothetical protein VIA18_02765 [Polyangia bacterium]|jgi:hypothetical protein|nr:hypothetical protein [Polyangia bacterium]